MKLNLSQYIEIKSNGNNIHKKFQIFKAIATLFADKIEMELIFIKKKKMISNFRFNSHFNCVV